MNTNDNNPPVMTLEQLTNAYQQLHHQFTNAQTQVSSLQNELSSTRNELMVAQGTIQGIQLSPMSTIKLRKPESFSGKGSIRSWITHMTNYVGDPNDPRALAIAVSYLHGTAHEWWLGFKDSEEGRQITTWAQLQDALIRRFETLNKIKIARDKLARWKQIKDISSFNEDFQKILLDIPNITVEEQIDRYARGLKPYIWKELCTKEYANLSDFMRDAERVESAHKRYARPSPRPSASTTFTAPSRTSEPVPMDIGNVSLKKLTPAEREMCRKEGRCFRCREKGHMANKCPKGRGN